ncbi:hypothetical protein G6F57_013127 [Rhizopus arrhizus]|uniref:Uncharacterized protein n=1 Tax=Rhizopus oryzae TaxID=64495 RepID=A0A9P6X3A6_RHIOR|nr:hypothetical protein G6F23_010686 [Rhizopus arrhizus]KAG1399821.1 hypothetical protein G6F58_011060 [Rhizopus delemar]KAG0764123.1 hypothetical protein G6F24_005478 [Rhizopus arrhizus]KAG0780492.1 hypothetical protein G6F22_010055 [Rhizopus arrhizus]KAG0780630.1 hypothetical protein G6F21_012048 [Rhizopus arrhizus]
MSTFNTVERERIFRNPSNERFGTPSLQEVVAPHIEAFNSISEFGEGQPGLLDYAVRDIGSVSVFDNADSSINIDPNGNSLASETQPR